MNKNTTALILIVLGIGIYFTYTSGKIEELKAIRSVNAEYQQAINNSKELFRVRDQVLQEYNTLSQEDQARLNKIVPDNVDNVRLIIDVKDDIAARHGLALKNIKTSSPAPETSSSGLATANTNTSGKYGVVTLSFSVTTGYERFVAFLKDLEASLRIMDVSKLVIEPNQSGTFDFTVEVKTYWLRQ